MPADSAWRLHPSRTSFVWFFGGGCDGGQATGANPARINSRIGRLIFANPSFHLGSAKIQCTHNQRRTAVRASENVTVAFPSQSRSMGPSGTQQRKTKPATARAS